MIDVSDIHEFFKSEWGKIATVAGLNTVGVKHELKKEFWDTYRNGGNQDLSFVAARDAALSFLGSYKNPACTVSLDAPVDGASH